MKLTDANTPVVVGVAQLLQKDTELAEALEPLAMLVEVVQRAAADAGVGERLLAALDTIGVVDPVAWRVMNAPRLLADKLGLQPRRELRSGLGGETPVAMLNELAQEIVAGRSKGALLAGCNNVRTMMRARKQGVELDWTTDAITTPAAESLRETLPGSSEMEQHYGLVSPTQIYPVFENALRARRGLSLAQHRARMGALFSPFTKVAARNPFAWFPTERSAAELTTATSVNRMIGFPYTKYLNAVMETDQAACVLLTSLAEARRLGVAKDKLVYWRSGADGVEQAWFPTARPDLSACPAMKASLEAALARAGIESDEIDRFDLYSCFPAAVGMACEMLGLAVDDPRELTVTGGLPYAGGPGNNYTTHAIAGMVDELRAGRGHSGLVTGNGWYLTKHSAAVLSTVPPEGELHESGTAEYSGELASAAVELVAEATGEATVETYTVLYGRDGAPERGIVIGRQTDGSRFLANTPDDRSFLEDFVTVDAIGRSGQVRHRGDADGRNLFEPS